MLILAAVGMKLNNKLMKKNPYRIGDWVYCNNPQHNKGNYIMKVDEVDSDGWISGVWSTTGKRNGHSYIHYRYATQEEIYSIMRKHNKYEFNYEIF